MAGAYLCSKNQQLTWDAQTPYILAAPMIAPDAAARLPMPAVFSVIQPAEVRSAKVHAFNGLCGFTNIQGMRGGPTSSNKGAEILDAFACICGQGFQDDESDQ